MALFCFPEPPVRWRGPVKNSDFVVSNSVNNNGNGGGPPKKPSYVGLSCSVSGYGPANRYTSPDGRRTSPEQIPVGKPPQILDSVGLVLNSMRQQGGNSMDILDIGRFFGAILDDFQEAFWPFGALFGQISGSIFKIY